MYDSSQQQRLMQHCGVLYLCEKHPQSIWESQCCIVQYYSPYLFLQIQNDQCQEMDQTADQKWIKLTSNGEWGTHTVSEFSVLVTLQILAVDFLSLFLQLFI